MVDHRLPPTVNVLMHIIIILQGVILAGVILAGVISPNIYQRQGESPDPKGLVVFRFSIHLGIPFETRVYHHFL